MRLFCLFVLWMVIFLSGPLVRHAVAQSIVEVAETGTNEFDEAEKDALGFSQGSFIAVPIPSQNPTFETGLALGTGWVFKADEESSNSFIGLGLYGSTNGSLAYGLAANVAFNSNRYKLNFVAAELDLNYDLIVFGLGIPLKQTGEFGAFKFSYGFTPDFSVGIGTRYLSTTIKPNFSFSLPPELIPDLSTRILSAGLLVNWDRRDDSFYSTEGTNLALDVYQHVVEGQERDYQKGVLKLDGYYSVGNAGVVAARLTGCRASENAPFFDSCALGAVDNFRGFSVAENIGLQLASLQLSWRGRFGSSRFGYEVFAGAGRVFDTFPGLGKPKYRSAGGVGGKLRLTRKFPLDLALDVSVNDAGDRFAYIYVGQRF